MKQQRKGDSLLGPYRVLDLTDDKGFFAGKILADFGADVIKIEPPGGDPSRQLGPFYKDIADPQKSLFWFAYNNNKRGITLNIDCAQGQRLFKRLVEKADFVIESFDPGRMASVGLDYESLKQVNKRIIMTSISPFGQTGPYKDFKGPDLVTMALGGYMYVIGDPERPPVRISFPQAFLHCCGDAAVGTMVAHHYRVISGEGQYVDVSAQQSVLWLLQQARIFWDMTGTYLRRQGSLRGGLNAAGVVQRQTWPCKDGAVSYAVFTGHAFAATNRAMVKWLDSEGFATDYLKSVDWDKTDMMTTTQEFHDRTSEPISRFFMAHTMKELYEGAKKIAVMLYPVSTAKDLLESPQLNARGFWVDVEHPELGDSIRYPGACIKSTELSFEIKRRAPLIGEHNEDIYGELGLSKTDLVTLKEGGVI